MTTPYPAAAPGKKSPPPPVYRWVVLLFISLAMFGNYYIYDSVSPLADILKNQLGFSDSNIGFLYAIYSIPNIFMVLLGGIIIDRIGIRKALFAFALLCLLGAGLTAARGDFSTMAAGRLVFGLGAESMIVAVTSAVARWFWGKQLSFAFGLNLTLGRLGSFAALNSPTWAKGYYESWQGPLLIAAAVGLICVVAALAYWLLESQAEKKYALGKAGETDKVELKNIFRFGVSYWWIVALCVTFYSAIFPFQTFAVKFFVEAHGVSRETAGFLSSMLTLFAMIGTPLIGLLADYAGRRTLFMMIGSALLIPVYLMMAYTDISLYVPMALMGLAFSTIPAVMWPSVAYVVESRRLGTAYGLMTMVQNIGLAAFNLIIGKANDYAGASQANPEGYALGMWIFSCLGFFGLLFSFLLRRRETGPEAHGLETIKAHE